MFRILSIVLATIFLSACNQEAMTSDVSLERGKYLVTLMGCNDCHTAGYLMAAGNVPEAEWLKGDEFGWRGPWGTTYGANLRLFFADMTEAEWVDYAKTMTSRPPMPWFTLNHLKEDDARAMYRYITSLAPGGKPAPAYLPPDREPPPPFALFPSPPE